MVQDTNQATTSGDTHETAIIDVWYTAAEAGCASDGGLCAVSPGIAVGRDNTWKVQACANDGNGLWSAQLDFNFGPIVGSRPPRFIDNGDGTVTDNNTTRMWTQNASIYGYMNWYDADAACDSMTLAGYDNWRLPVLCVMWRLLDITESDADTPDGHPFTHVQMEGSYYWTADTIESRAVDLARVVEFHYGIASKSHLHPLDGYANVWCARTVRGAQ